MSAIVEAFKQRLIAGFERKSATRPSKWACLYRMMGPPFPGPWSFLHHPWLREMHDSVAPENSGQKAAQMGFTETLLNIAFYTNDVPKSDVLYLLPNQKPDASDFSSARFDAALELSQHLRKLYSNVNNVGHKMAGSASFYLRGSQSKSSVKSVPASVLLLDEVEEHNQDNIPSAYERLSGQTKKLIWAISTASVTGFGINKIFNTSSQEHFFFKCPHCSKMVEFLWPQSIVITAEHQDDARIKDTHLICTECKATLDHNAKTDFLKDGVWVPTISGREYHRGFYINQLYSSTVSPEELARAFLKTSMDQVAEQEFWNSKLGLPHEVSGARICDSDLIDSMGKHVSGPHNNNRIVTMGVDQGRILNYEIAEWTPGHFRGNDANSQAFCRILEAGTTQSFDYLDELMRKYRILYCVIDAHPERRMAFQFSQHFYGHVSMCFYGNGVNGKQIHDNPSETGEPMVVVDRTSWMDLALGRFKGIKKGIALPMDISREYKEQIKAPVRIYKEDMNGNPVGRYVNEKADHYAHARTYAEIAYSLAMNIQGHHTVS